MKVERPCGDRESRVGGGGKDDVDVELQESYQPQVGETRPCYLTSSLPTVSRPCVDSVVDLYEQ